MTIIRSTRDNIGNYDHVIGDVDSPKDRSAKPYRRDLVRVLERKQSTDYRGELRFDDNGQPIYVGMDPVQIFNATLFRSAGETGDLMTVLHNRVYEKFQEKVNTNVGLGTAIFAEGAETIAMITQRINSIATILRALKRGRPNDASRAIKELFGSPKARTGLGFFTKGTSGLTLELGFGWLPLFSQLHDLIERLTGDIYAEQVVHARSRKTLEFSSGKFYTGRVSSYYNDSVHSFKGTLAAGIRATVIVDNKRDYIIQMLGFGNPAEWAWEAIPFSFLVDYFVNIGDMIQSLNAFAGVKLADASMTYFGQGESTQWAPRRDANGLQSYEVTCKATHMSMDRFLIDVPKPRIDVVKRFPITGLRRSATTIALACQWLTRNQ